MIFDRFHLWMRQRWSKPDMALMESYKAMFSGEHGQRVLFDMIDNCYATVCESNDYGALVAHNARRKVVHEILRSLDIVENPQKYGITVETVFTPTLEQERIMASYGLV